MTKETIQKHLLRHTLPQVDNYRQLLLISPVTCISVTWFLRPLTKVPIVPCSLSLLPQSTVKELLSFSSRTTSLHHLLGAGIAWKWWWFTDSGWVIWTDKSLWFNHLLMISSPLAVRHHCPASRECRKQSVQPEKTQGDQPEQCSSASLFLFYIFRMYRA